MNNKINVLALVVSSSFISVANANQGQISLLGSVTDTTCEIVLGGADTTGSLVQLGEAAATANSVGPEVTFSLAPAADSTCAALTGAQLKAADVTFAGAALDQAGISNASGTATGAIVKLVAKPSTGGDVQITALTPNASFPAADASGASASMNFTAQLVSGGTAGTYSSSLAYTVAYK